MKKTLNLLSEFSIPLIAGVIIALVWANVDNQGYTHLFGAHASGWIDWQPFGHPLNFYFIVNDIFMVFFFGIAAVEITQSILPGGSLNPVSRAINPLLATLGGILGPVGVFFLLCYVFPVSALIENINSLQGSALTLEDALNGWGIPTATDIALAWLVARLVFGKSHPAVSFLLLVAVGDDAIGLGIIAIFYPDPNHPVEPIYLLLTASAMVMAFLFRKFDVQNFWYYVIFSGTLSWLGLIKAHLHPALALVFIVPFLPHGTKNNNDGLFETNPHENDPLENFEHAFKIFVDMGLLGFGLANAGVAFAEINSLTWVVLLSLVIGKTIGITFFSYVGHLIGFRLPERMDIRSLSLAGLIASLGLTVSLFVAGEAYTNATLQGAAKMGAVFSAGVAVLAVAMGKLLKIKKVN